MINTYWYDIDATGVRDIRIYGTLNIDEIAMEASKDYWDSDIAHDARLDIEIWDKNPNENIGLVPIFEGKVWRKVEVTYHCEKS